MESLLSPPSSSYAGHVELPLDRQLARRWWYGRLDRHHAESAGRHRTARFWFGHDLEPMRLATASRWSGGCEHLLDLLTTTDFSMTTRYSSTACRFASVTGKAIGLIGFPAKVEWGRDMGPYNTLDWATVNRYTVGRIVHSTEWPKNAQSLMHCHFATICSRIMLLDGV